MKKNIKNVLCLACLFLLMSGCSIGEKEDTSLMDVQERGTLVVGTFAKLKPMSFLDESGNYTGHDIELIKEVANRLGVSVEIKDIFFPDLFPAVEAREIDLAVSAITITPERTEKYLFSIPYFFSGQMLVIRKDSIIKEPKDLIGKMIGVVPGTTGEEAALRYVDDSALVRYEGGDRFQDLIDGKIDVIIEDYSGSAGYVKNNPEIRYAEERPFTDEYYGMASKSSNHALISEINGILEGLKDEGMLHKLEEKWMK